MPNPNWSLRKATSADKDQILDLHQRTFHSPLSPEQWAWQFEENPTGKAIIWIAVTPSGQVVGHHCLVPVPFQQGNETAIAGYSILSMIDPNYQKQGMLKSLAAASENQLTEELTPIRLTYLNDNSLPVYTKHLGWTEIGEKPPIYFTVLDPTPVVEKLIGRSLTHLFSKPIKLSTRVFFQKYAKDNSEINFAELREFDSRIDTLWKKFSASITFATIRDARYLNWRYLKNPKRYRVLAAEKAGEILGFVVFRSEEKFHYRIGYIADLLFDPAFNDVGGSLLSRALDKLREENCSLVTALVPEQEPTHSLYRSFRFLPLPKFLMPHGMHFCFKVEKSDISRFSDKKNWYSSWSDHDVI